MQQIKYIFIGLLIALCVGCGEKRGKENFRYFQNYQRTFNDLHARHMKVAQQWGIEPITTDNDFERQEDKLSEITSCRHYEVDKLTHSIPYLVPRAEELLEIIGRNFRDSLDAKELPDRKIIVTSILRTRGLVKQLQKKNINASSNSTHVYGTTFDIAYARYNGAKKKETDKLKTVLAEVLNDLRKEKKCYVLYELKQACFHITVR